MSQRTILLIEDELAIAKGIELSLRQEGFIVERAADGKEGLEKFNALHPDLVLLDLMLPEIDGLTVCREIRKTKQTPIIMLTAKSEDIDIVLGLELGADDYLTKPFSMRQLIARIKAVLRRVPQETAEANLQAGELSINFSTRKVNLGDQVLDLTPKEYELLLKFMQNPGRVFTRENLLEDIWGFDHLGDARTVDVHVRRLREKVEPDPANPRYILTKWGVGYYFQKPDK